MNKTLTLKELLQRRPEKSHQVFDHPPEDASRLKEKKDRSLLKKRKNEELAALDEVFGNFESFLKKAKLELSAKAFMTFEHERNRMASVLDDKSVPRTFLRGKIEDYKKDVPPNLMELVNEDIENLMFEFDPNLAEQKLQEFNKVCDLIDNSFQNFMDDQCRKIGSLDFPQELLIVDVEPKKVSNKPLEPSVIVLDDNSIKINSCLRFIVNNRKLRIRLNPKMKKTTVVKFDAWKNVTEIQFSFNKLLFEEGDLQVLEHIFSKLTYIQKITLTQDTEVQGTESEQQEDEDLESLVLRVMKGIFLKQQDLKAIELALHSYEEGNQIIRILARDILPKVERKNLKDFEVSFTPSCTLGHSFKNLLQSLSLYKETLQSVELKLSNVSIQHCQEYKPLNLPELCRFTLEVDCSLEAEEVGLLGFLLSSLRTMKSLKNLDIKLYSCDLRDKKIMSLFEHIDGLKKLRGLSWKISPRECNPIFYTDNEDYSKMCRMVSLVSNSLLKMSCLSNLHVGYGQEYDEVQNQQEIKNLITECRNHSKNL